MRFPILLQVSPRQFTGVFARHSCWHRNFQLFTSAFHCESKFFVFWFNEEDSSQQSGIIELWFLDSSIFVLLSSSLHQTRASTSLAIHCQVLRLFVPLVSLSPDHVSLVFFGLLAGTLARFRGAPRSEHLSTRSKVLLRGVTFFGLIRFPQHLFSVNDHGRLRSEREPQVLPALPWA